MSKASNKAISAPSVDDWRAQDDMRTLTRAAEIQADKARMSAARREAEKQVKALSSISAPKRPTSTAKRLSGRRI